MHLSPGRASIDTTDDEVDRVVVTAAGVVLGTLAEECLVRVPGELVEEVDSVDEDRGLVLPNVGGAEGLANTVGGGNGVGIHHCDIEAIGKSPGDKSVMQVGKPKEDGAAVPPATNHENTKTTPALTGVRHMVSDLHVLLLAGWESGESMQRCVRANFFGSVLALLWRGVDGVQKELRGLPSACAH